MKLTTKKKEIIKWSVYWGVLFLFYIVASAVLGNFELYAFILAVAAVNCAVRVAAGFLIRRQSSKRLRYSLIAGVNVLTLAAIFVFGYVAAVNGSDGNMKHIAAYDFGVFEHTSEYSYDGETGVYTVTSSNDEFKILQLTDVHICASINTSSTDRKAFDACYALIKDAQPDLIIVTGDIAYTMWIETFSVNNRKPMQQFCTFMSNVGIPWAMVYGNHDTDPGALYDAAAMNDMLGRFANDSPLLYADKQPSIYGRYNQYIRVENADGSLNRVLFLIDSNDYPRGSNALSAMTLKYDRVHDDQIEWYSNSIDELSAGSFEPIRSFVYMHIPFEAFDEAQTALANGDPDAVYLFGANNEGVCCPDAESGFFDKILEKHSTDAVFVGHDHLNTMGVKYKGVDLVYSKSIDFSAYPRILQKTEQRGATLVTLERSGDYRIEQIDYKG